MQVVLRYRLHAGAPREIGGLKLDGTATDFAVVLSQLHYFVRYVSTSYGALLQHNTLHVDLESMFQVCNPGVRLCAHMRVRLGVWEH